MKISLRWNLQDIIQKEHFCCLTVIIMAVLLEDVQDDFTPGVVFIFLKQVTCSCNIRHVIYVNTTYNDFNIKNFAKSFRFIILYGLE